MRAFIPALLLAACAPVVAEVGLGDPDREPAAVRDPDPAERPDALYVLVTARFVLHADSGVLHSELVEMPGIGSEVGVGPSLDVDLLDEDGEVRCGVGYSLQGLRAPDVRRWKQIVEVANGVDIAAEHVGVGVGLGDAWVMNTHSRCDGVRVLGEPTWPPHHLDQALRDGGLTLWATPFVDGATTVRKARTRLDGDVWLGGDALAWQVDADGRAVRVDGERIPLDGAALADHRGAFVSGAYEVRSPLFELPDTVWSLD